MTRPKHRKPIPSSLGTGTGGKHAAPYDLAADMAAFDAESVERAIDASLTEIRARQGQST